MTPSNQSGVLLVVLLDGDLVQAPEHLGVGYLLAALRREGFGGSIIEVAQGEDDDVIDRIARGDPFLVGLTLTTVSVPRATSFGEKLRKRVGPTVHITAGGPLATFLG